MLSVTVQLHDGDLRPHVKVVGTVSVANATEFSHLVRRLTEALGEAHVDLTELGVADAAGMAAVRHFARHAEEFGGQVVPPQGWVEWPRSADETAWRGGAHPAPHRPPPEAPPVPPG